jgi:hypothetical protein
MLKKFLLKIFHKKHKFTSKTTFANVNSINTGNRSRSRSRSRSTSNYSSDMIKRETLTCEICGHVEIIHREIIDRPSIRFHQGNITEPLGTILTKKT